MTLKSNIIFLSLIFSFVYGTATAQEYSFDKLTIKDGLSDNSVRDILQDSRGYLWFASLNGLDCYDGQRFKNYTTIPGDERSLNNSRIQKIIEDERGYIWCITLDGNVSRIDPATNKVIDLYFYLLNEEIPIRDFKLMPSGKLLLWGFHGCVQIHYHPDNDEPITTIFNQKEYLPSDTINFVHEDSAQHLWIGTEGGVVRLTRDEKENYIINNYLEGNAVRSYADAGSHLWFGTLKNGLRKYEFSANSFQPIPSSIKETLEKAPILKIQQTDQQKLLIGSMGAIYDIDFTENTLLKHRHPSLTRVERIYKDTYHNYWIATVNRGIFKYDITQKKLAYFDLNANSRAFLGDSDKQIFLEDSKGNVWVGIHGGGIFLYNQKDNNFTQYTYSEKQNNSLSSNQVLCLYEDNSKNLWVGTMHGGVNKCNLSTSPFIWYQPVDQPQTAFDNEIRAAAKDRFGNLWVGSKGGQIIAYDSNFQPIRSLPNDLSNDVKSKLNNISVYCLYFDKGDNLWIGTKGKGIFVVKNIKQENTAPLEIIHFDKQFNASNTAGLDEVYSIKEDHLGQFWIGSHFSGLTLLQNPFTQPTFKHFIKENVEGSLISNFIRVLFLDQSNNLWIGTSHGINLLPNHQLGVANKQFIAITNDKKELSSLSYNSVDYIFQTTDQAIYVATMGGGLNKMEKVDWQKGDFQWKFYNKSMGLSTNKVYTIEEDEQENLWMSTSMGIDKFNPTTEAFENFFIEKNNGLNYFTESCVAKTDSGAIIFGHNQGFLKFNPKEISKDTTQYPVVLSRLFVNGLEITPKTSKLLANSIEFENAIELNHQQNSIQLDFSVLDFGYPEKIQFSYKLEGFETKWSTPLTTQSALYQNLPPGDYTFLLKGTNSGGVAISQPLQFAISINPTFLKTPLGYALIGLSAFTVIGFLFNQYKQQIEAKHQMQYTEIIHEKKLKYYTNISHEFKTPLTMILSPVEDIIQHEKASPEIISYATHIRKNATYLLELVEQILDFRKIREEKMPLAVANIDLVDFIKNIFNMFKPLADRSDIDFLLFSAQPEIKGYVDPKIIEKVLFNLLSNAFEHTPANKQIALIINAPQNGWLELLVRDEGMGIQKKDISRLFERFYRSENSSGLGLFFVKELVNHHRGKIEVESEWQKGTTFVVKLPIGKEAYQASEQANKAPLLAPMVLSKAKGIAIKKEELLTQNHYDKLLIIDDNEEIRTYVSNKFKTDFRVFNAVNGEEGIALAIKEMPDVIICDVMMPVLDGIETTRQLRKNFNTSHIPIILLTANSSDEKRFEGIELGADDYITKPFDFRYLKLKIDSLIQQRKQLRTHFNQAPELSADTLTRSAQDKAFIKQVSDIINENIGKMEFSVELLSKKMNCSRTNFYKKMKGVTGETPHEFIRTIQMKKAALLLKETNHSISDIGYKVGFSDANYFSKAFKKHFGKTPKVYQRQASEKV